MPLPAHLKHLDDKVPFISALEGAQHGGKKLPELVKFCEAAGFDGVQPSNYHFQLDDGTVMTPEQAGTALAGKVKLVGISAHCLTWVRGSAWTGTPCIRPFIPAKLHNASIAEIEQWADDTMRRTLDLAAALGIKTVPMFWGNSYGLELASGYPWGFYKGPGYDLLQHGDERFVSQTKVVRDHARSLGINLAHEIHPGTAAATADDFLRLVRICDNDVVLGVNADPSHCWEGEDWMTRFTKVGQYITGVHVKDHVIIKGRPLRSMTTDWQERAMQFTQLGEGQIDLPLFAQLMLRVGYVARYNKAHGTTKAPLVGEAESAVYELDVASSNAATYINTKLCLPYATGSFEDGMGA